MLFHYSQTIHHEYSSYRARYSTVPLFQSVQKVFYSMDISLLKAPELIQWIYDKVTLPESLLFITHLKGLFGFAVMVISCLPALVLMGITGVVMSKAAEK